MSEEILNEIVEEEIIEELPVEEPIVEEPIEEILPQRVNPFCVISKNTFGEYAVRDIQSNSSWGANPYGEDYAIVPDDMVTEIMETRGFCDIVLNEDETEVVEFTAREIPEIPVPTPEPTAEERIAELEENLAITELTMIENYEAQEEINSQTENALIEIYEMMEV